jgi:hypothetical protein
MKISGERTAIAIGDIVVLNEENQTIKIKRGKDFLYFNHLLTVEGKLIETQYIGKQELQIHWQSLNMSVRDLFKIILAVTNLTAFRVIGSGKPDEEYWQIQEQSENPV